MPLIPERLVQMRNSLNLSQADLGEIIELSQKQISKYETGESDAKGENLARLARALDTTTDWLVGLTDNPAPLTRSMSDLNEEQRQLLDLYRRIPMERRAQAIELLKVLVGKDDV